MKTSQIRTFGRIALTAWFGLCFAAIAVALSTIVIAVPLSVLIAGLVIGGTFGWLQTTLIRSGPSVAREQKTQMGRRIPSISVREPMHRHSMRGDTCDRTTITRT